MAWGDYRLGYNPDVLSCLANLSNDEVFTPPEVVNQMLDMLPQELFRNPDTTFLDPATKSGVFLREIAKRLIEGLEPQFPDLEDRLHHIFHKQLFGIAITELTSLLSRRSLYCSKDAQGKYAVSAFENVDGNIRFKNTQHTWENGVCKYCRISKNTILGEEGRGEALEAHAYEWIHTRKPEDIFNMKFDVIVGNPPYQLSDGGAQASATPIYNKFIEQAMKLKPRYLTMIIPARWFGGGKGLDVFRENMISDKRIRILHDFLNASDCFGNGVEIKGGVCYFLWNRDEEGMCEIITHTPEKTVHQPARYLKEKKADVFIRHAEGVSIYNKVLSHNEQTFEQLVSSQKPFGLRTFVKGKKTAFSKSVKLFEHGGVGYISRSEVERNHEWIDKYKIFISRAYNAGDTYPHQIIGKPILGEHNTCCTETYISIGPFETRNEAENVISYIRTKFFRFLVSLIKVSQMASAAVYSFVPVQDWSKPWTDEELYAKYEISEEEIAFIDSMIRPMDLNGGDGND